MVAQLFGRDRELALIDELVLGRRRHLAFLGPAGVGRSALLESTRVRAERVGAPVYRIDGIEATADIAFGAAAHLLPDEIGDDRLSTLRFTERSLVDRAGHDDGIVLVDDAHELDPATIALLHTFVAGGRLRVVVSAASDRRLASSLSRLWRDGRVERCDVGELPRATTRALIEHRLGDPISDDTEAQLWELTHGTPRYIDAILTGSQFELVGGVLRLTGDPVGTRELREAVEPALAGLSAAAIQALAAFAFGGALNVALVDAVAGPDATEELERAALVRPTDDGLQPTHPLLAAVAHAMLTTKRRRGVARALAEMAWSTSTPRGDALVRAVDWRLAAGDDCESGVVVRAAQVALAAGEHTTAARLAEHATTASPDGWEAAFVLGQARRQLGDRDGAEQAFARAMRAPDAADQVDVAVARAHNLGIAAGRIEDALELLGALAERLTDEVPVRRIAIEQTFFSALLGDFRGVADATAVVLDDPALDDPTAVSAGNGHAFASVMLLRLDDVDTAFRRARPAAERLEPRYPLAVDQLDLLDIVADVVRGRIPAAIARCSQRRRRAVDASFGCGDGAWAAIETFARSFTTEADLDEHARQAVVALRSVDPLGLRYVGRGLVAVALAQAGLVDDADRMWSAAAPSTEGERRSGALIGARLAAWKAAAAGDLGSATDWLASAGHEAIEHGHLLWGMLGLHDAVRLGQAAFVVDTIERVAREPGASGALLDAIVQHSRAAAADDPDALAACADRLIALGATRLAVDAAIAAGRAYAERGDRAASRRSLTRAQVLNHGTLPALPIGAPAGAALTDRQAEIVGLVVAGHSGPEIADRLSLSVRTVENHVAAVYRHLDISSRGELLRVVGSPPANASE